MGPKHEETHIAKGFKNYASLYVERNYAQCAKNIAASPELKRIVFHLCEKAPSAMLRLLRKAHPNCEAQMRMQKPKNSAQCSKGDGGRYKSAKTTCSTGGKTSSSRQSTRLHVMVQVRD